MTVTGKKLITNKSFNILMKIKNFIFILLLYLLSLTNIYSMEADIFVQSTVNRASKILSEDIPKEKKVIELKNIAKETVDINGIGFYTLGAARKNLNEEEKKKYSQLFEEYFLKSFSSRLAEYTNPEIDVYDKEKISDNYTIVKSLLKGTDKRPEVKIDWRIYTKNSKNPLIRDLIIEGLSLARTQKEEFSSILNSNNGDINILFKTLEDFSRD
jgi:phospholipid transport system substrate-binding protein